MSFLNGTPRQPFGASHLRAAMVWRAVASSTQPKSGHHARVKRSELIQGFGQSSASPRASADQSPFARTGELAISAIRRGVWL